MASITVVIGRLGTTTVRLVSAISEFVDVVEQAPVGVQELNNELAQLYSILGQIKIAAQAPRFNSMPEPWISDFSTLAQLCGLTLDDTHLWIEGAKTTTVEASTGAVRKQISLSVNPVQVTELKQRISEQIDIFEQFRVIAKDTRGSRLSKGLTEIHELVTNLHNSFYSDKESYTTLQRDDDNVLVDYESGHNIGSESGPSTDYDEQPSDDLSALNLSRNAPRLASTSILPETSNFLMTELMANIDSLGKAVDNVSNKLDTTENSELIAKIHKMTRLSASEKKAIKSISEKVWVLRSFREHKMNKGWIHKRPQDFSAMQFKVHLYINHASGVTLEFLDDSGAAISAGHWLSSSFQLNGTVVTDHPPKWRET